MGLAGAAQDWYPQEEGAVFDAGSYILPCYADGAITEMSSVKMGTSTSGRISVAASTAAADGVGVALKASVAGGDYVPVLFYGVAKMIISGTDMAMAAGGFVINSITTGITSTSAGGFVYAVGLASHILGMALQGIITGQASPDEILVLVGKCG